MQKDFNRIEQILTRYNLQYNNDARNVLEQNFLSSSQLKGCKNNIISALCGDKIPSKNPLAIIVGGQPGSGKTALINYTQLLFNNKEFVIIDNDFFRAFHPNVTEIRKFYPQFYTCATEQLGADITDEIIEYFMGNNQTNSKYDIILHQTLSKKEVATTYLKNFKDADYITGLNVLAVPYIESKMSQIERCQAQYNTLGFCRYVDSKHHFNSVSWLTDTVKKIEDEKLTDFISVYARSQDISRPDCVYTNILNEENLFKKENFVLPIEQNKNGFLDASEAIQETREVKSFNCLLTLDDRINEVVQNGGLQIPGMQPHIEEVENFLNSSLNNCPPSEQNQEE